MGGELMENTTEEMCREIGSRIRDIRLSRRMSQADLAGEAHMALPSISEIELGKREMRLSTFISIAEALQVSTDLLLRPDIPEVKTLYQSELNDLLADCTPGEIESIFVIVREFKEQMHKANQYNE